MGCSGVDWIGFGFHVSDDWDVAHLDHRSDLSEFGIYIVQPEDWPDISLEPLGGVGDLPKAGTSSRTLTATLLQTRSGSLYSATSSA